MIIGITGSLCSGKSAIVEILKEKYPDATLFDLKRAYHKEEERKEQYDYLTESSFD
jgi:dephospho-CoA kinase